MKNISKALKIITVFVLTFAFVGCNQEDPILPELTAGFTHTINQDTGTVTFINTSLYADSYVWYLGDDTNSTLINPIKTYPPGTYNVVLTATNVAGASDTFEDMITIGYVPCTDTELKLPIDFDCETIDYAASISGNVNFTVTDNPELSGINSDPTKVGQITNVGDNFENAFFNLDVPIDFSNNQAVSVKIFSNQALPVLLKFEDGTEADVEDNQLHTGTGWEELTFTLSSTGTYNDMILFVAFNQTDAGTFYLDDFAQISGNTGGDCVAETTESIAASDLSITFQTDSPSIFGDNTSISYIDNPDSSGSVNSSCRVAQVTRFNSSAYDNAQIDLTEKLDFNTSEGIKLKVWSPIANTPVLLKLEEIGNSGNFVEILQNTGDANTWTELTYDFNPTSTPQFNKIVIFFNFNVSDGSTYYFDDLMVYGSPGGGGGGGGTGGGCSTGAVAATAFPVDFEGCESFTSTFSSFGSSGVTSSLVENPDPTGINTSDSVLRVEKSAGIQRYGGVQNAFPSNFDGTGTFKFLVYSPVANITMRFEINSDPQDNSSGNPGPQFATITDANTWTEVTINFTGIPPNNTGVNQLVIKPNNPEGTDLEFITSPETYYFDNIRLE